MAQKWKMCMVLVLNTYFIIKCVVSYTFFQLDKSTYLTGRTDEVKTIKHFHRLYHQLIINFN